MKPAKLFSSKAVLAAVLLLFLHACSSTATLTPIPSVPTRPETPVATETMPPTPTSIPEPLAALVNGIPITLGEYQAELERFQAATGGDLTTEQEQKVLDDLVNQVLLAQAAAANGFVMDEEKLQARLDKLIQNLGSQQALDDWMSAHGYTLEEFKRSLNRLTSAAWMRDEILGQTPASVEQVHARQILLRSADEAQAILSRLNAGQDFAGLAKEVDPVTNGELGWFPRGYLLQPELEQPVFSLEPGQYSEVIQTSIGYHILQVIERQPERPLDPQALLVLQEAALRAWLEQQRQQATIEIFLP